jgi:hypothetical protein
MEVMLDLETFSTKNNACILIIAGVKFNRNEPHKKIEDMDTIYLKVDSESCKKLGMDVDSKTVEWWNNMNSHCKKEIFSTDRENIKQCLLKFSQWFGNSEKIWSHGATFDIPILGDAYNRCGLEVPWKYWNSRDTRTLFEIANIKVKDLPQENMHNALYDCWRQVWGVKESFKKIKN